MNSRWSIAQHFEARWWRFYLRNKDLEGYLAWKKQYWEVFLNKTGIVVGQDTRILDAGCGPAGIFILFPEHEVEAVDPLLDNYQREVPFLQQPNFKKTAFVKIPLEQYQTTRPFDLVFCINAINHVADPDVCLGNLRKASAPGGQLVLTVDAHNHAFLKTLFRTFPGDILHPHQMDLKEYLGKIEAAGFAIQKTALLKSHFIFDYHLIIANPVKI
ncbi:MAG: class I SAM-dependent methyltransferase [Saprospiraceae bacterium]